MKKIIITLVVSLVAMFAFSNKANAQYIDDTFRNDSTFVNNPYVRNSAMLQSIEWQKASREERAGRTLFYSGLATQVVGTNTKYQFSRSNCLDYRRRSRNWWKCNGDNWYL